MFRAVYYLLRCGRRSLQIEVAVAWAHAIVRSSERENGSLRCADEAVQIRAVDIHFGLPGMNLVARSFSHIGDERHDFARRRTGRRNKDGPAPFHQSAQPLDRKSTRLNSSH